MRLTRKEITNPICKPRDPGFSLKFEHFVQVGQNFFYDEYLIEIGREEITNVKAKMNLIQGIV